MKAKFFWIGPVAVAITLSGCHSYYKAGINRTYVDTAKETCDVSTLAEERTSATAISDELHGRILPYREGYREEKTQNYTILTQKLKRLDGAIDASYRMAMASCASYNACLIQSGYNEGMCVDNFDAWDRSRTEFNQLAVEMKRLSGEPYWDYSRSRAPETLMGLRVY